MSTQKKRRKKSRNIGYYAREGLKGIASHGFMSFAAITIIAACLLITGTAACGQGPLLTDRLLN